MRILICAPPIKVSGGISRWIENILDGNKRAQNYSIDHLPMRRSFFVEGLSLTKRLYWGLKDYYNTFKILEKHLKSQEESYSVVHIASSASVSLTKDIFFCLWLRTQNIQSVVHFHFGRIPLLCAKKNWEYYLIRVLNNICNDLIVIDKASESALISNGFRNVNLVYNPLSNVLQNVKTDFFNRNTKEILFVGEVLHSKGVFDLLLAIEGLDIELTIVGHYEEKTRLEVLKLASKHNISVTLTGRLNFEGLYKYYSRCGIFVLPSHTEGFPNVIIEAMAFGCPIIATNVGAIPQMLSFNSDEYCGILISPKDINHLRSSIQILQSNHNLAELMGENARIKVNREYNENRILHELYAIWNKNEKK